MQALGARELDREMREGTLSWALLPYAVAGFGIAIFDRSSSPPPSMNGLGITMLIVCAIAFALRRRHERLAAWLLSCGSIGVTALAWAWFPTSSARYTLCLSVTVAAVVLGIRQSIAVASLATVVLFVGKWLIAPLDDSWENTVVAGALVWAVTHLSYVSQRAIQSMLTGMWHGYSQSRQELEASRHRQLELKQSLADLDLARREVIRLNDLLSAAREAVEEARRAKEEFVANVSHELRTPLNMIIGYSDEILERPQVYAANLPAPLIQDVAAIRRNSEHLANLVDDVLDLAESDAGYAPLAKRWVSMGDIIRQATEQVSVFFESKRIALHTDVAENLAPIHCDDVRIRQVILNILSNAARFTVEGSTTIRATQEGERIAVSVTDTGPGMDARTVKRVFEPFQQGDPSIRRRYGGTGLGLAISKRFIEMHGGRVWIESQVGVGTTVSFTLPLSHEALGRPASRWFSPYHEYTARTHPSMAPSDQPKPRVVICESGNTLSDLTRHYGPNLDVITVSKPGDLAQTLEESAVAAVILNQMPTTDQTGGTQDLPPTALNVPIISCCVHRESEAEGYRGYEDYMIKPIRRPDLLASIRRTAPAAKRILLVEDDVEGRQLFRRMLSAAKQAYEVVEAADGVAALRLIRTWHPDLVLLDLVMPEQDGFSVLAAKEADDAIAHIPVIIISATDPRREPLTSNTLTVMRHQGLVARDLVQAIEAIVLSLPPRFGALNTPASRLASQT